MSMISHLVVALDGSQRSERSLPHARYLAQRHRCKVTLVSVIEAPTEFTTWAATPAIPEATDMDRWLKIREEYLGDVAQGFDGLEVETTVTIGSPARAILEIAGDEDGTLIVIASHGRTGLRRLIIGSVASRLVRRATCPLLVVPAHDDEPVAQPGVEHVLVPLDGSDIARHAFNVAFDMLDLSASHVHLLRVIEGPDVTAPTVYASREVPVDYDLVLQYQGMARVEAEEYLGQIAAELNSKGVQATWEVTDGDAATEIRRSAQEQGVNLIAMATHGRSGFDRWVLGSVAEKLLSEIHRPIFLVGPRERA